MMCLILSFFIFTASVQRSVDYNESEVEIAVQAFLKYALDCVSGG